MAKQPAATEDTPLVSGSAKNSNISIRISKEKENAFASQISFGLVQQGYDYTPEELAELSWGLRFTPTVCMVFALIGLMTQKAWIHFTLAALGILPFWFPASHPLDRIYNHILRPIWGGVLLPPNPLPRRIACFMGGLMNIFIGSSFVAGNVPLAYFFGAILIVLQLVVITTHFCVASWLYEVFLRLIGRYTPPISTEKAHELVKDGALLVDVRDPNEYAKDHLPDAINVPLSQFEERLDDLLREGRDAVLYCRSGLRSQRAVTLAKSRLGSNSSCKVYNLGGMSRWDQ